MDWGYNAWGGKYPPYDLDDIIPSRIGAELGIPVFHPGIVMEGGALDVNGEGTLLTTEACLLNPNRNPHLSRDEIEGYLRNYLGVRHILWLGDGIVGDDTDGHVDDLTRFTDAQTVVTVVEDDPADENYARLRETGDQQIWYPDEAASVRQMFESELAKRGLTSDIPEEAYRDRDYKWDYGDDDD